MKKTIGIGEWNYARGDKDSLQTFALGSCVGVIFYDPSLYLMTMAHVALPDSLHDRQKSTLLPAYFADSATKTMYDFFLANLSNPSDIEAKIFGGAKVLRGVTAFDVGKANIIAVEMVLEKYRIPVTARDTGAHHSRSITGFSSNGSVLMQAQGQKFLF